MNESWIKLYRKVLNSGVWRDKSAWRVFSWLLLSVDRKFGTLTVGRYQGSRETGLKPTTFYQALNRLEKLGIIVKKMTPRYTVVNIVKWAQYQGLKVKPAVDISTSYPHKDDTKVTLIKKEEVTTKVENFKKQFLGQHQIKNENIHGLPN